MNETREIIQDMKMEFKLLKKTQMQMSLKMKKKTSIKSHQQNRSCQIQSQRWKKK